MLRRPLRPDVFKLRRSRSRHAIRSTAARPPIHFLTIGMAAILVFTGVATLEFSRATDVYQRHLQSRLSAELGRPAARLAFAAGRIREGSGLTRLRIPTLGVDVVVVEGTSASALRAGAGHYRGTPLPGQAGNVAIAGHRTTYGKPFADLDRLRIEDLIVLETPIGSYRYRVNRQPFVIHRADWTPIENGPGHTLTLTTCHPKRSDRQRLVVQAELVKAA